MYTISLWKNTNFGPNEANISGSIAHQSNLNHHCEDKFVIEATWKKATKTSSSVSEQDELPLLPSLSSAMLKKDLDKNT